MGDKIEELPKKWEEMDRNILMSIFACLSVTDVVFHVTGVCHVWLSVAKDYCIILKNLDLSNHHKKPVLITHHSSLPNAEISMCVRIISDPTVNISCGNLTTMVFDLSSCGHDSFLLHAAQRCRNLKHIVLPFLPHLTENTLAKAFKWWPKLESLAISFFGNVPSTIVLQSISQNCKELKSLRFWTRHFSINGACIISSCFTNLRSLSIQATQIQPEAVMNLMKELKNLEEMYISHTVVRHLQPYGMETSIIFCLLGLHKNEEIAREARRFKKFHICRETRCNDCTNEIMVIPLDMI